MNEPRLNSRQKAKLQREAKRLISSGQMPSPEKLLKVIAQVQRKYVPQILAARREA